FPGGSGGSPRRRGKGHGLGFTLNIGWGGPRVGDLEYLVAATSLLLPVAHQFAPELVLVSAGFDAGKGDPLGGCQVTPPTFGVLTHLLAGLAGGRLVLLLEGGYNLEATAEGVSHCLRVLLGAPATLPSPSPNPLQPSALVALARTLRAHRPFWASLRLPLPRPDVTGPPHDITERPSEVMEGEPPAPSLLEAAIEGLEGLKFEGEGP
ncbi:HDAC6 deacetylase, partial [Rhinopomastus cyanomelas]|nr:HDAC6 deacetylase [Rhinopomastus cyanomelas]